MAGVTWLECDWCGGEFSKLTRYLTTEYNYCCLSCSSKATMSRRLARAYDPQRRGYKRWARVKPRDKQCRECGTTFTGTGGLTFCSEACKQSYNQRRGREFWETADIKRINPRQFSCRECGDTIAVEYGDKRREFCSPECRQRWSGRNGKPARRARKRGAYVADVSRQAIYERDKVCQLCGKRVRFDKEVPHPQAPTLDHIVPLSCGGTHEPANVQLAHFGCNSQKGNRGCGSQLRLLG